MNDENTIFLKNASQIVTPKGTTALWGKEMSLINVNKNSSVYIENGIIKKIGKIKQPSTLLPKQIIDCHGKCILPGFVDSHTHFVFYGYREQEFFWRLQGKSYMEIMQRGGGIINTVEPTRNTTRETLIKGGIKSLNQMLAFGITTVEGKSGYGLDKDTEIKQLKVMKDLNNIHPVDVVSTFLGAHALPKEYAQDRNKYIDFLINDMLPMIAKNNLAEYCDVFCEKGVYDSQETKQILLAAKKNGLGLKVHADEMSASGGSYIAAKLQTVSADHLLHVPMGAIKLMAKKKVISTLLPLTAFCLKEQYAPAREIIDAGGAVALASDYNPGSCCSNSIPLIIALAAIYMHMSLEEIITALTLNGAAALNRAKSIGSIEEGKQGDIVMLQVPEYKYLPYFTGVNLVDKVIKKGKVVYEKSN